MYFVCGIITINLKKEIKNMNEKPTFICVSKVKKLALELAQQNDSTKQYTRVSGDFLLRCDEALKQSILDRINNQSGGGKTLN
jgi:hypothetical protein